MAIATLSIDIVAKLASIERDMGRAAHIADSNAKKMEESFARVGSAIKTAFAGIATGASVAWLTNMVTSALDAQDALSDLNKSTGISIDLLAGLKGAASSAGTDLDGVAAAVNKLAVNMAKDPAKFAALGIDAKEPLEALKQLADVFASIEDPQQRAAFGAEAVSKSWASLAPLLADGGKSLGDLVEKFRSTSGVTEESARRAADLNDKLDILKNRASGAGLELVNQLVPSLTRTAEEVERLSREGQGLSAVLRGLLGITKLPFDLAIGEIDASKNGQLKSMQDELNKLVVQQRHAKESGGGLINDLVFGKAGETDQKISVLRNQISALEKFGKDKAGATSAAAEDKPAGPGAAAINTFIGAAKPAAGARGGGGRTAKAVDDGARLVEQLRDQVRAMQDLSTVEKLELAIADGKYKTAKAGNLEIARGYAQILDNIEAAKDAAAEEAEVWARVKEVRAEGARVFDATRTPFEALTIEVEKLAGLLDADAISMDTFGRAAAAAGEKFQKITDSVAQNEDVLNEFAKSAAQNIQSTFADFLFDPFKEGTAGMLQSFGDMIKKMIANAVAADLTKRLFGDLSQGGAGTGLISQAITLVSGAVGGSFASGTDYVPRDMLAQIHEGEAVLTKSENANRGRGPIVLTQNFYGPTGAKEVRRAGGELARNLLGMASEARRYG